ncbi:MAG: hypothetical protein JNK58_04265, partial [Phycisphaerae bacterium]|nr:hypothetical protein [Phycisphaerae bacterium]
MLLGCLVCVGAFAGSDRGVETAEIASVLRSAEGRAGDWRSASSSLLLRLNEGEARAALQGALWDDRPPGVRRAVAEAVIASEADASGLVRSLGTALAAAASAGGTADDAILLIRAIGKYRTMDAARALVENAVMGEGVSAEVRSAGMAELARLTGRKVLGEDARSCAEWWNRARWLSGKDWEQELGGSAPEAKPAVAPGDRLAGLYRRLHAATPESGRDALLVEMLDSPEEAVRSAGFDLIMLALVNAKALGEGTATAATRRLADDSPAIRAEAARTIELLGRIDDLGLLWNRLQVEVDESAAAAMMRAGVRHPEAGLVGPAIRWIETGGSEGVRSAAAEALEASRRAGLLSDVDQIERVRAALRARAVEEWSPATMRLAVGLGMLDEVKRIAEGADRSRAKQAGAAMAENAAALDVLVRVAEHCEDLYPEAVAGLQRFSATADGYARLAALPSRGPEEREAALAGLVRAMPPAELSRFAGSVGEVDRREALLAPIVTTEFLSGTSDLPERVELALMLARCRVMLDRPADALATLALLPNGWQGPRALGLRVT